MKYLKRLKLYLSKQPAFVWVLLLLLCGWPSFLSLKETAITMSHFHLTGDEGLHTELIEVLSQTHRYGLWKSEPYAPFLTTGPAVILPATVLQNLLGISSAYAGRTTVFIYHLLLLSLLISFCIFYLKLNLFKNTSILYVIFLSLFFWGWRSLSETQYYSYGVLGEGSGVFWLVLTCYLFWWASLKNKIKWLSLCAFTATLAFFSKPYLALFSVALMSATFIRFKNKGLISLFLGYLFIGALVLFIMVPELGFMESIQFWVRYPTVMKATNGAGVLNDQSLLGLIENFWQHVSQLHTILKPRGILLFCLGLGYLFFTKNKNLVLFKSFTVIHGLWWFVFSPGVQARYFFPLGVIAWIFAALFILENLLKFFPFYSFQKSRWRHLAPLFILFFSLKAFLPTLKEWNQNMKEPTRTRIGRELILQGYWKNLSREQRPTTLYSFASSFHAEQAILLTAPYEIIRLNPSHISIATLPKNPFTVVLGEELLEGAQNFLKHRKCTPRFLVAGTSFGFWDCPKSSD